MPSIFLGAKMPGAPGGPVIPHAKDRLRRDVSVQQTAEPVKSKCRMNVVRTPL